MNFSVILSILICGNLDRKIQEGERRSYHLCYDGHLRSRHNHLMKPTRDTHNRDVEVSISVNESMTQMGAGGETRPVNDNKFKIHSIHVNKSEKSNHDMKLWKAIEYADPGFGNELQERANSKLTDNKFSNLDQPIHIIASNQPMSRIKRTIEETAPLGETTQSEEVIEEEVGSKDSSGKFHRQSNATMRMALAHIPVEVADADLGSEIRTQEQRLLHARTLITVENEYGTSTYRPDILQVSTKSPMS